MKVAITGATGFVGSQLVPRFEKLGYELLLVGRDLEKLKQVFPNNKICDYSNMSRYANKYDVLLHLAAQNNDKSLELSEFETANIGLLLEVGQSAIQAGIPHFINLSSTHAFYTDSGDAYSQTKREGGRALKSMGLPKLTTVFSPAIYGNKFRGKLSPINRCPQFARSAVLDILATLRPVVSIDNLFDNIVKIISEKHEEHGKSLQVIKDYIVSDRQLKNNIFKLQKRLIDFTASASILVFFFWLYIIIALLIISGSPGSPIFAQKRVGKNRKIFTCYKFRTMSVGTPDQATHLTSTSNLTEVGKFLRATKLDELPQMVNILRNDMSLVGPRPCLPSQTILVERRCALGVYDVVPGITGLGQVYGLDMSDPEKLANIDAQYVALRTALLDFSLIIKTILGQGQGDRVSQA